MPRARSGLIAVSAAALAAAAVMGALAYTQRESGAAKAVALGSAKACAAYNGLPAQWLAQREAGMVRVAAGEHVLGSLQGYADERPVVKAQLGAFLIDATEVSNAQFAAFVAATHYVTTAETLGGGAVFRPPADGEALHGPASWWRWAPGADWRHPDGADSSIQGREHEPVVQVSRTDAAAYAAWLGHALPTEAQWEAAARIGVAPQALDVAPRAADGTPQGNFWQGLFPFNDAAEDGHAGRAPVGCYAASAIGLYDMIGNVWEWTADTYSGERQQHGLGDTAVARAAHGNASVEGTIKGGSYLCASNFCVRYRASARHPQEIDLPTSHVGFRTVLSES